MLLPSNFLPTVPDARVVCVVSVVVTSIRPTG